MIFLAIGLIALGVVAVFFLVRWFIRRAPLRQARRACRKGDQLACKRYEELRRK